MSSANKAKGTQFEREIAELFTAWFEAQRLPRTGAKDEGDIEVRVTDQVRLILEAKNHKSLALADWIRQAEVEADHREAKTGKACVPVVVAKRRGKGVAQSYVVMQADEFLLLLKLLVGAA